MNRNAATASPLIPLPVAGGRGARLAPASPPGLVRHLTSNAASWRQDGPFGPGRTAFFFAALMLALAVCPAARAGQDTGGGKPMPRARDGVIDLTGWSLDRDGPVRLDGGWELYPGRFAGPDDFAAGSPDTGGASYVLPGPWNREGTDGGAMGADTGYATLRLRVQGGPGTARPALALFNVNAAYRLWIGGELAAASGRVGTDAAGEVPLPSRRLIPFDNAGGSTDLVLQISNYHYRDGGLLAPVWLGPLEAMQAVQDREIGAAAFFVGAFLIMGLYHLGLYWFRRKNPSTLYFALYCLAWMGNFAASDTSGFVMRLAFPGLGAVFLDSLALGAFFVSVPVGYAFFRSLYPAEFSRRLEKAVIAVCAVFVGVAVLAPGMPLSRVLPLYYLISCLLIAYCLQRLYTAVRRGRHEAAFLFAGFVVLGAVGVNDMLTDMKILDSRPLLPMAMLVFILFQAFALSRRLSRAFAAEERLSGALEEKNAALTAEMAERTRLEGRIVSVSEDERRRISLELHDGLCQGLTAARLRLDAVSANMPEGGRDAGLDRLSGLLDNLVDQAYDLSRGLWPLEHDGVGVGPSFRDMIRRLAENGDIPVEFHRERACEGCRNPHLVQIYRIAQEAVANAVKHSGASRIEVSLTCPGGREALLTVRDDGRGRAAGKASPGGLGLGIMAHRARIIGGELRIGDAPGGGTLVACRVPCRDGRDPDRETGDACTTRRTS